MLRRRLSNFCFFTLCIFAACVPAAAQRRLFTIEQLVISDDLPPNLLKSGDHQAVSAKFNVGVDGKPANCRAFGNDPRLGALTCKLIKERAAYIPAYDKSGNPVVSSDLINVLWARAPLQTVVGLIDYGGAWPVDEFPGWRRLPSMSRPPFKKGSAYLRFEILASGRVGQCVATALAGEPHVAKHACESLQGWSKYKPPVDEKGEPFGVIGSIKFDWLGESGLPRPYRQSRR